jgi:hypothetical protein
MDLPAKVRHHIAIWDELPNKPAERARRTTRERPA